MRLGVAAFVALLAFLPSGAALWLQRPATTSLTVACWFIPFALWLLAWVVARWRATMMIVALGLLLAAMTFVPVPEGFVWPRIAGAGLAFAVTVAALTSLAPTLLASLFAVALLTIDYSREIPYAAHLSTTLLDAAGTTAVGLFVLAGAVAVVAQTWDRVCKDTDAASIAARDAHAQSLMAEHAAAARSAVDRRIHETVLNTLAAIAWGGDASPWVRAQCAEDLRALDSLSPELPLGVHELVNRLMASADVPSPVISGIDSHLRFRDPEAADAAFSALTEVLRNVERHARATTTTLRVKEVGNSVAFTVVDDGVGMEESSRQRFGMRRAVYQAVKDVGGSVEVKSTLGVGTEVSVVVPLAVRHASVPQSQSALDILLQPPAVRVAMLSLVPFGLLLIVPAAQGFSAPMALVGSYLLLCVTATTVAVRWGKPGTERLAWLTLVLVLLCQAVAWVTQTGCDSAAGMHLIVLTTTGALMVPALALRHLAWTAVMLAIAIASTLFIPWVLPARCRPEAVIPAFESSIWLVCLVGIVAVLATAVDRSSRVAAASWAEVAQADARRIAAQVAQHRWRSVDQPTRALLATMADGGASPGDPEVHARAARLEARLRALIETSKIPDEKLRESVDDLVERVSSAGVRVSVLILDDGHGGEIPASVVDTILGVAAQSRDSGMHLTLLDGEILVSAHRVALLAAGCTDLDEAEDPLTAVVTLRWSVGVST